MSFCWFLHKALFSGEFPVLGGCDYDLCEMCFKHHLEGWANVVQKRRSPSFWSRALDSKTLGPVNLVLPKVIFGGPY